MAYHGHPVLSKWQDMCGGCRGVGDAGPSINHDIVRVSDIPKQRAYTTASNNDAG